MNKRIWVTSLVVVGTWLLVFGLYRVTATADFKAKALPATASVIYLDCRLRSQDERIDTWDKATYRSDYCYETIVFYTQASRRVVWQSRISGSTIEGPGLGQMTLVPDERTIKILYDPDDPHEFRYATFGGLWAWAIAGVAAGTALLSLAFTLAAGCPIAERIVEAAVFLGSLFRKGALNRANFSGPEA